jgi:hypothetical protein
MASLFAYLSHRDAPAAIDWLEAIGFRVVTRQPGDDGTVLHAELSLGDDAVVMLASADADYTVPPRVGRSTGRALPARGGRRARSSRRRSTPARPRCWHRRRPSGAPSAPASSIPRATSGRSAPTSPAAAGEALERPLVVPCALSRRSRCGRSARGSGRSRRCRRFACPGSRALRQVNAKGGTPQSTTVAVVFFKLV